MVSAKLRRAILSENTFLRKKLFFTRKKIWVHDINQKRKVFGEFHHLYQDLRKSPDNFYEYARMEVETFDYILEGIKHDIAKKSTNWRESISPEERLFVTIRYLSTGLSIRSLSFSFRIGESTLRSITVETSKAIWKNFRSIHMAAPSNEKFLQIAEDFYKKCEFPNCIGALDGKHCRIKCPPNSGSAYFNYKKFFSIVLQAVADSNCKFIFIEVGNEGSQSDGGIFAKSNLLKYMSNSKLDIPHEKNLPQLDVKVPFVFVADEAYPLMQNLMRPYPRRSLDSKKRCFNEHLSKARRCIECAFGILEEKWRILKRPMDTTTQRAIIFTKTMCLLHNIIIEIENIDDFYYLYDIDDNVGKFNKRNHGRVYNTSRREAKEIREKFANFFEN